MNARIYYIILALSIIGLAVFIILAYTVSPRYTAVWKGRQVAQKYGCFNCHGFEGHKGIPNPGYTYGEVPAWQGGTAMMFIFEQNEIKEWILYGRPKRLESKESKGLIKMPAYKDIIGGKELDNLVLYLKAVMELIEIDNDEARLGYEVAKRNGCFGCHGPYGMGGMPNPRSFKGYIPGWDGEDFEELVKSEDELREWINNGNIKRLSENIFARYFTRRQVVQMPAYREHLKQEEINYIIAYIKWLRGKNF